MGEIDKRLLFSCHVFIEHDHQTADEKFFHNLGEVLVVVETVDSEALRVRFFKLKGGLGMTTKDVPLDLNKTSGPPP